MANTVNVTKANTFEQWRVKTNELGTALGDLDTLTASDSCSTTVFSAPFSFSLLRSLSSTLFLVFLLLLLF